jgi:hypothetical protein
MMLEKLIGLNAPMNSLLYPMSVNALCGAILIGSITFLVQFSRKAIRERVTH